MNTFRMRNILKGVLCSSEFKGQMNKSTYNICCVYHIIYIFKLDITVIFYIRIPRYSRFNPLVSNKYANKQSLNNSNYRNVKRKCSRDNDALTIILLQHNPNHCVHSNSYMDILVSELHSTYRLITP